MDKEIKDLEQVVLQGLEYEKTEKEKSAERKAMTRKNGLKPEDAKYSQETVGQTRDIVAEKLGISGRHWERMKYVYLNKDQCVEQEYIDWKEGKISTSKLYIKLNKEQSIASDVDKILSDLWQLDRNLPRSIKKQEDELRYILFNYPQIEKKVFASVSEIKRIYDEYIESNAKILIDIISAMEKLKKKTNRK